MITNTHEGPNGKVLTICDEELIGKTFTEGKLALNISERFYNGRELNETEFLNTIKEGDVINIVGEKSIHFAIEKNLIDEENVKTIQGIPHAQSC